MWSRSQSVALLLVLTHFLLINLAVSFVPAMIPHTFRPFTLLFSGILIVDIALIVRDLRDRELSE